MDTVAIFCSKYPPYRGGTPNYYRELVDSLSHEYEIVVFSSYHPKMRFVEREDNVTVYRLLPLLLSWPWLLRLSVESAVTAVTLSLIVLRHRIDLIHSHATSYAIPGVVFSTLVTRRPVIYDCRDEAFPPRAIQIGFTPVWFSASSNIDQKLAEFGADPDNIVRAPVVNPSYVSEYAVDEDSVPGNPFHICFCGRFRAEKNVPLVVDAFTEFRNQGDAATLTLIGDGLTRNEVEQRIKDAGVGDHVEITGELPHETALEVMASCDVLVLPSESEGVPRVIVETFELGIPVVATAAGGIEDVVTDGKTGIIVQQDQKSIADALKRIRTDKSFRRALISNGQAYVQKHSWRQVVDEVSSVYDEVLSQ